MKTILAALALTACGSADKLEKAFSGTASDPKTTAALAGTPVPGAALQGYIVSAFEVVVDGVTFPDIEAWFTAAQRDIASTYRAAGHDLKGRTVQIAAQAGMSDFWAGIEVFALAQDAGELGADARVHSDGTFAIRLPAGADSAYQLRAIKRFNVQILKEGVVEKNFCYILNAAVDYALPGNSVKIDEWETQLTSYGCTSATLPGIAVPAAK